MKTQGNYFGTLMKQIGKSQETSFLKTDDGGTKSMSLYHESLVSLFTSLLHKNQDEIEL